MKAGTSSILRHGSNLAVYVASQNRVKIVAVEDALQQLDSVHPLVTVSGNIQCVTAALLVTATLPQCRS